MTNKRQIGTTFSQLMCIDYACDIRRKKTVESMTRMGSERTVHYHGVKGYRSTNGGSCQSASQTYSTSN